MRMPAVGSTFSVLRKPLAMPPLTTEYMTPAKTSTRFQGRQSTMPETA
jgi:hypothetical protein